MSASRSPVTDLDDPRLAPFRDLTGRGNRDGRVIVEGAIAVRRLAESGRRVEAVLATANHAQRLAPALDATTPLLVAETQLVRELVGFAFHRGCLAVTDRPSTDDATLDTCIARLAALERTTVVVLLGLADPVNVGAVIRTARAFAVDLVLCDRRGADPYSRRAVRASMGNVFCLPVLEIADPGAVVGALRDRLGARVVASSLRPDARPLGDVTWPPRAALVLGNEGRGLPRDLLTAADLELTIPIEPAADSLNVASAAAIILHHAFTVQNRS